MSAPTPTDLALLPIQSAVSRIDRDATPEDVARALGLLDEVTAWAKARKAELEAGMVEWIGAHGDLVLGSVRYYVGTKRTTRCIDAAAAADALLSACGGDVARFAEFLCSDPYKAGAVKAALGELPASFEVREVGELREGVARKTLQRVDTRFIR